MPHLCTVNGRVSPDKWLAPSRRRVVRNAYQHTQKRNNLAPRLGGCCSSKSSKGLDLGGASDGSTSKPWNAPRCGVSPHAGSTPCLAACYSSTLRGRYAPCGKQKGNDVLRQTRGSRGELLPFCFPHVGMVSNACAAIRRWLA